MTLEGNQMAVFLVLTNMSGHDCTMYGFGGVDLHGPDDPQNGPVYSLRRSSEEPALVRLTTGASAHVTITYLRGSGTPAPDNDVWQPSSLVVTPPDETTPLTVPWTAGDAIQRQDSATHPGTYISPVAAGVD